MKMKPEVILVTGASSGIGKAIVDHLVTRGHVVFGAARRLEKMKDLEEKGANILKMDITNEEDVQRVVDTVIAREGRIDVLMNNAGFGLYGPVEEIPIADAKYQFDVNLFGLARLTQLIIPHMRTQQRGKIINMSSIGGKVYTLFGAWYHATKHALEGWSDCLRLELQPFGIHVIIVEPGIIKTAFGDVVGGGIEKYASNPAYKEYIERYQRALKRSYEQDGAGSPPSVIAKVVAKAIRAKKPKTRYAAGKYARTLLFMRKWLGDRMFDRLIMGQTK